MTAEIKINRPAPVTATTGKLTCKDLVVHAGRHPATAEGKVRDRDDRLFALGVYACQVFYIRLKFSSPIGGSTG